MEASILVQYWTADCVVLVPVPGEVAFEAVYLFLVSCLEDTYLRYLPTSARLGRYDNGQVLQQGVNA